MSKSKLLPLKGKLIALDLGTSSTGLAITDVNQSLAFIRDEILHSSSEELIAIIEELIQSENIVGIVIGYPLDMQNKETQQTALVNSIISQLDKYSIFKIDERRTSIEASKIKQHKMSRVDSESAYILLNNYINLKNQRSS